MDYYYVPQNAWGVLDAEFSNTNGLYSEHAGPCTPVALYCIATGRLIFTHSDVNLGTPLSEKIVQWMIDYEANKIFVSATSAAETQLYIGKLNTIEHDVGRQGPINESTSWYCNLSDGLVWVNSVSPNDEEITLPDSYAMAFPNIGETMTSYIVNNNELPFVSSFNDKFFLLPPDE